MLDAKQLGLRLRQLREEQGLTQEKLAYECGRAKSYLCEIEAGKKLPSLTILADFASRLNVSVYDLLVFPTDGVREMLIEATRKARDEDLATLAEGLSGLGRVNPSASGK